MKWSFNSFKDIRDLRYVTRFTMRANETKRKEDKNQALYSKFSKL